ncbi:MAG TPA: Plug domain-containing protein [Chitinophagaceae bacterium]|nr:Plug domain-containing protein [Chitinophagaceae bacterium]
MALAGSSQDDKARLDEAAGKILVSLREADNLDIILHTDKAYYPLGSTLWFRVYLVRAFSKIPAASARVYVDLLNEKDSIVSRTMLNSASHEWDGGIRISSQWKEGLYRIRVYTAEMLVSPAIGKPLEQTINFFSTSNKEPKPLRPIVKPLPGIAFFPEGGNLINGLPNLIAYRCFDQNGDPISAFGYLRDERKETVETFNTNGSGYGKFNFSPSKNRKYQAVITMPDKSEKIFDIPAAPNNGWQISVTKRSASALSLRVAQGDSLYPLKPVSYLVGISSARLLFASVGRGVYEVNVPLQHFPAGAATFYLLNEKQEIVSTRQVTLPEADLQVNILPNKQNYAPRETVNVDIDLKDGNGLPMNALLSISVTDDRYNPLERPVERNELLDIIEPAQYIPARAKPVTDSTMRVLGLVSLPDGQPAAGHIVSLVSTADNLLLMDTADDKGRYFFRTPEFYDGKPYMIQVTDAKGGKAAVTVTTEPEPFGFKSEPALLIPDTAAYIRNYVTNQADSFLNGLTKTKLDALSVGNAKGKNAKNTDDNRNKFSRMITGEQLDKLQLGTTANAVMMIPGVIMMQGKLTIRGGTMGMTTGLDGIEPLIIVDGVPAGSSNVVDIINSIPPHLVDYIEVLAGGEAGMYGTRGANGVIIIKTNTELREDKSKPREGPRYIYPPGYHLVPEFFMPKYEIPQVRDYSFVDNRSTIFWKGELITDKNGKGRFSFYAADQPSTYTITVKGVSSKGDLIDKRVQIKR